MTCLCVSRRGRGIVLLTMVAGACSGPQQEATVSESAGGDSANVVAGPREQSSDSGSQVISTDIWDLAASSIRHLPLDSFPDLPVLIRQRAWTEQCAVPQPSAVDPPQNVVAGEFAAPGQTDWAVLCTQGDSAAIFIEWGGAVQCPTPLAWGANRNFLQSGPNEIEYSRAIGVASPQFILERAREYDGPAPPSTDHSGINDAFLGKASIVHYCHQGRWFRLTGSD